jgi:hypothetical protein
MREKKTIKDQILTPSERSAHVKKMTLAVHDRDELSDVGFAKLFSNSWE